MGVLQSPGAHAMGNREPDATLGASWTPWAWIPTGVWFLPALPGSLSTGGLLAATAHPFIDLTGASLCSYWGKKHHPLFSDAQSTAQSTQVQNCRSSAGSGAGTLIGITSGGGAGVSVLAGAARAADGAHTASQHGGCQPCPGHPQERWPGVQGGLWAPGISFRDRRAGRSGLACAGSSQDRGSFMEIDPLWS